MIQEPLKILYVDDDEDDYFLIQSYLKEIHPNNYEITWATSFSEAVYNFKNAHHDLFIFDFYLGGNNGIDLIKTANNLGCETPIILLTARENDQTIGETLRLGASDYLTKKDLTSSILQRSIRYSLERASFTKELQKSERRYRKIFEDSGDILFITSPEGTILDFNQSSIRITGLSESELQNTSIFDYIKKPLLSELWSKLTNEGELFIPEFSLELTGSDKMICEFSANYESNDTHTYVLCRISDITIRKQIEQEKNFSEKMEVSNRLIRILAHEIRNPLSNITLSSEQLESEFPDDSLKFYTQIISRNSIRINSLITQLLQTSRPDVIELKNENIIDILNAAIEASSDRLHLKKVRISLIKEAHASLILADSTSLQIAFLNLFINAIDAVSECDGNITISISNSSTYLEIKINDNGIGMTEETMKNIFEPYYTNKPNGMGIGLSTVMSIIHSHDGKINVNSVIGQGTTFTILLPKA